MTAPPYSLTTLASLTLSFLAVSLNSTFAGTVQDRDGTIFQIDGSNDYTWPNYNFANLSSATFTNANFSEGSFLSTNFGRNNAVTDCNFEGANLGGARMENTFTRCNFKLTSLSNTHFDFGTFKECNFQSRSFNNATWNSARFKDCNLTSAFLGRSLATVSFTGSDLSNADFSNADIRSENDLENTTLTGASFFRAVFPGDVSGYDFTDCTLNEAALFSRDLRNVNFTRASLSGVDFSLSDLTGNTTLLETSLTGVNFNGAKLGDLDFTGMVFSGSNLSTVDFRNAELSGTNFTATNLFGARFDGANLNSANLASADLSFTSFRGASLKFADLRGFPILETDFSNADLSLATFRKNQMQNTFISGATLLGVDLSGANLESLNLSNVNFSFSNLEGANMHFCSFANNDFFGANLKEALMTSANMDGSNFEGADLTDAKFFNSYLLGAKFAGANLTNVNFSSTRLQNADLNNTTLTGVVMNSTRLEGANLRGASGFPLINFSTGFDATTYDAATRFPTGIDPLTYVADGELRFLETLGGYLVETFGHNADPAIAGPEADPDHDGVMNVHEFVTGTNALNHDNTPPIQSQTITNEDGSEELCFTIRIKDVEGVPSLRFSSDMVNQERITLQKTGSLWFFGNNSNSNAQLKSQQSLGNGVSEIIFTVTPGGEASDTAFIALGADF